MIFTFLLPLVPLAGLSDGACTVTVSVSPPLHAATPAASAAATAVEMQSRLSDMAYLLLEFFRSARAVLETSVISSGPPASGAGRHRGRSRPWSPAEPPSKGSSGS